MKPLIFILDFFTSLRLTVICLTMAMVLVFIGTIAQVKLGLYLAQEHYFQSLFVFWQPNGASWKIPVWPGGYLLGGLLLVNLIAAQIRRFHFTKKKIGIYVTHAGLILLFVGQFATQLLQIETFMAIPEGASTNYSESGRVSEIAVIDTTDANTDHVVAIPETLVARKKEIRHPDLPFTIKVQEYAKNSDPTLQRNGEKAELEFRPAPEVTKMEDRNYPAATIQIIPPNGSAKTMRVSTFLADRFQRESIRKQFGSELPDFDTSDTYTQAGRTYRIVMRSQRFYKPHTVQLLHVTHEIYKGTDVPKNFSSRVRLTRPDTGEDREALIYMNNPLRYDGETYYQSGLLPGDSGTILQVVRNPSWLTPYISCAMVAGGLVIQFMSHLIGFAKKRAK